MDKEILELIEDARKHDVIFCKKCGMAKEPEQGKCYMCGKFKNIKKVK